MKPPTPDLPELDRDLGATRVVDGIRRDVSVRLAARAGQRRRQARDGWLKTLGLVAAAAVGALLTWVACRRAR